MNLFVQGMRRSGTTVLFDALLEDRGLRCFYEPLSVDKEALGGGSGIRSRDLFAEVRPLRRRFARSRRPPIDPDSLNHGAPRAPELELEADLPDHAREWLRFLLDQAPDVVIKETRLYCKVPALSQLDPDARLLHVVRDPRAVATSYLMGRGRKRAELFPGADAFFEHRSKRSMWASRPLAELLTHRPELEHLRGCPDFMQVLLVWRFTFEQTRRDGLRHFGDRYRLLRHEDLTGDPRSALASVFDLMGRPMPRGLAEWAKRTVSARARIVAAQDERWTSAFARVGLEDALHEAGYGHLAARPAGSVSGPAGGA